MERKKEEMTNDLTAQTNEIMGIKKRINSIKEERSRVEGQLQTHRERLGSEFGVANEDEAAAYIQDIDAEEATLKQEINEDLTTIREELGW